YTPETGIKASSTLFSTTSLCNSLITRQFADHKGSSSDVVPVPKVHNLFKASVLRRSLSSPVNIFCICKRVSSMLGMNLNSCRKVSATPRSLDSSVGDRLFASRKSRMDHRSVHSLFRTSPKLSRKKSSGIPHRLTSGWTDGAVMMPTSLSSYVTVWVI
ncbi:Uncharacterized protein DAT39_020589, partial [Clarias magur]